MIKPDPFCGRSRVRFRVHPWVLNTITKKQQNEKTGRTARQTQAGIGHSTPAHRGGHVQNRIRRRQARRVKIGPGPQAEQPRMDGGPGRQAKVCQHRRGRGLAGAHCKRHTKQESCDKIQTLQLHVPRGHTAQGSCRVEQERTTQAVAATAGIRLVGNAASNTASAWSGPEHTWKRSSRRRASAIEVSRPGIHWHSNSRCSMWRHLCSLAA